MTAIPPDQERPPYKPPHHYSPPYTGKGSTVHPSWTSYGHGGIPGYPMGETEVWAEEEMDDYAMTFAEIRRARDKGVPLMCELCNEQITENKGGWWSYRSEYDEAPICSLCRQRDLDKKAELMSMSIEESEHFPVPEPPDVEDCTGNEEIKVPAQELSNLACDVVYNVLHNSTTSGRVHILEDLREIIGAYDAQGNEIPSGKK